MLVKNEPSGGYASAKREDRQGGDKKRRSRSGAGLWKKETKGMAMGDASNRDK